MTSKNLLIKKHLYFFLFLGKIEDAEDCQPLNIINNKEKVQRGGT